MNGIVKNSLKLLGLPVLSEPVRVPGLTFDQPSAEYIELSQQLGVNRIPIQLCQLAQIVREETMGTYPYDSVVQYLDKQAAALSQSTRERWRTFRWCWRPVKEYGHIFHGRDDGHFSCEVYDKPIPAEVLPTIARIVARMPAAEFFVSDIEEFKDPFLAVTIPGSDTLFVIERWEEPSFR